MSILENLHLTLPIEDPTWIFLLVLLVILATPLLLDKLRIPHIIGMILVGMALGEHGLGILSRDSSFELFGQVGLYYIMLLAGLEMNMGDFKQNRFKALALGLLCFAIPISLGFAANVLVLGYSAVSSILLASMYASNTQVSYPIVIRYGISHVRTVSIAVGGTAVTDTLTLLVLAVVGGMFKGEDGGQVLWLVAKVIVLGAFIIWSFPKIARAFFRRYDDAVAQYIFVLAMVFFGAGLMMFVGMQGILGAFLTGLVLNRLIPKVSPLMNHLEFVGNALFIPYFLIGVGMLIDLRIIFGHLDVIRVALIMITVALTGKLIACWIAKLIFRLERQETFLMYGLSTAQAAATLAAVMVGYNIILPGGERLLGEDVLNGTVLLILVSCIVSSVVTERSARRIATDESRICQDKPVQRERILIPISNPQTMDYLMQLAVMLRNPRQEDNLVALNVLNDSNISENKERQARQYLERMAKIAASSNVQLTRAVRYDLNTASGIIHAAREYEATDIVLGLHWKGNIMDSFFGQLTEAILRNLSRQVMISKFIMPLNTIKRVIVAVPAKAEYEAGFSKWVTQMARLGQEMGCRVHFYATKATQLYLRHIMETRFKQVRAIYTDLENWDDLLLLTGQVSYDHLLVIVSSRAGSISYNASFSALPGQISNYFNNNSLLLIYPDQEGDGEHIRLFDTRKSAQESQLYERIGLWLYNKMRME